MRRRIAHSKMRLLTFATVSKCDLECSSPGSEAGLTHYNSISKISSGVIRASFFLRRSVDVPLSLSLSR